MEWVNIKDKEPKEKEMVLLRYLNEKNILVNNKIKIGFWMGDNKTWWVFGGKDGLWACNKIREIKPDYWMSLQDIKEIPISNILKKSIISRFELMEIGD